MTAQRIEKIILKRPRCSRNKIPWPGAAKLGSPVALLYLICQTPIWRAQIRTPICLSVRQATLHIRSGKPVMVNWKMAGIANVP